ncbi:hypothetical protein ACFY4C_04855 [Actinomadura viridis]
MTNNWKPVAAVTAFAVLSGVPAAGAVSAASPGADPAARRQGAAS